MRALFILLLFSAFPIPHSAFAAARPTPTPAPEAEWDAGLGLTTYGAEIKSGCWYPVWVEIRATRAPVRGRVTVTQPGNPLRVEIPIDVAKGSRKIYRAGYRPFEVSPAGYTVNSYSPANANPFELEFKLEAEPIGTASIPLNLRFAQPGDKHLLILCEQVGSFNFLNRLGGPRDAQGYNAVPAVAQGRRAVQYGKPDLIPDDPVALQSLDAMIIDTPEVRRLDPAQWAAIRGWVARGGRLLLAAGRQQPFIQQSPLKDPFGVRLRAPEPATSFTLDHSPVLASFPEPPATPWDLIWLGSNTRPFLAGRRVGMGWFNFCAAALDKPVVDVLMYPTGRPGIAPPLEGLLNLGPPAPSPLLSFVAAAERDLGLSLQRGFAVTLADIGWVILYLLAYNLIAMPLNWWICRRLGRPAWSWPVLVLLAIAFAWYGYHSGMERQQKNFQVNELAFISRPSPEAPAQALACTTLFTPRRITGDLPATGRAWLTRLALSDREVNEPLTLGFDPVTAVRGVTLFPWTVLNLRGEFTPPETEGIIEVDLPLPVPAHEARYKRSQITLTNKTSHTFTRWWIRYNQLYWPGSGPLEAGQSVKLNDNSSQVPGGTIETLLGPEINGAFPAEGQGSITPPPAYEEKWINEAPLYFVGEASGVISPFAQAFKDQKTLGRIFYEQPLPMQSVDMSVDYYPRVVHEGDDPFNPASIQPAALPVVPERNISFPAKNVVIAFTPAKSFASARTIAALRINYVLTPGVCPIMAYRFSRRSWDRVADAGDKTFTLDPAADYLDPRDGSLYLRIDGRPERFNIPGLDNSPDATGGKYSGRSVNLLQASPPSQLWFSLNQVIVFRE